MDTAGRVPLTYIMRHVAKMNNELRRMTKLAVISTAARNGRSIVWGRSDVSWMDCTRLSAAEGHTLRGGGELVSQVPRL